MLKIYVEDREVHEKSGTSQNNKPYRIREQTAYVELPGKKYPVPFRVNLPDDLPFYEPGEYTLDDSSYMVGQFEALKLGRITLKLLDD